YIRADLCFFQAEDGIRDFHVTGVQTCALPISRVSPDATVWLVVLEPPPPSPGRFSGTKLLPDSDSRVPMKMRLGFVMPLASARAETESPYFLAIEPSGSPDLTMWKPDAELPPLPPPEGLVNFWPTRMRLGLSRLFALAMAATVAL